MSNFYFLRVLHFQFLAYERFSSGGLILFYSRLSKKRSPKVFSLDRWNRAPGNWLSAEFLCKFRAVARADGDLDDAFKRNLHASFFYVAFQSTVPQLSRIYGKFHFWIEWISRSRFSCIGEKYRKRYAFYTGCLVWKCSDSTNVFCS